MLLETLKEKFKQTIIEPRLSGKQIPDELLRKFTAKIDLITTLDGFIDLLKTDFGIRTNAERHLLSRIIAWENEPPFKRGLERELQLEEELKELRVKLEKVTQMKRDCVVLQTYEAAAELRDLQKRTMK